MINYLAEHHNAHLRYGAAMAVGIACAGSGSQDALKILVPLTQDKVDFVKQGALIALAFVFVQVTEVQEPKVATIKKTLRTSYRKCSRRCLVKDGGSDIYGHT